MKNYNHTKTSSVLSAAILGAMGLFTTTQSNAASIQVDLGNDLLPYTGIQAPAHHVGALGVLDSTWNSLSADAISGLFYTDGTAATGITVDLGRAQVSGETGSLNVDWNAVPGVSTNTGNAGFYATTLMQDWLFADGRSGNPGVFAVRIQGLAPGAYSVYAIATEHTAQTRTYNIGIGVDTDDTTAIGDLMQTLIAGVAPDAWVLGQNYAASDVVVNSTSDWVVIMSRNTNNHFGSLQGFQIVAIPEPSTALYGLLFAAGLFRRRRG